MKVQNISFKDNLISKTNQNVSQPSVATQPQKPDTVEISSKKKDIIKYSVIGAGVVAAVIVLIKHKPIGEFLSKLFKKEKVEPEIKSNSPKPKTTEGSEPTTPKPAKPKSEFKLPEPIFTCGEENPEKFAQEKRAYIDSIRKYLKYNDKEANIQSLKALEKYGSWEDCENLGGYIGERDPEIIRQFVKTVGAIGKHKHSMLVTSFLRPMHKLNSDILVDILNAESKIGRVSDQKWVEPFLSHEDESVRKAAQNTVEKIKEMNNTDAAF